MDTIPFRKLNKGILFSLADIVLAIHLANVSVIIQHLIDEGRTPEFSLTGPSFLMVHLRGNRHGRLNFNNHLKIKLKYRICFGVDNESFFWQPRCGRSDPFWENFLFGYPFSFFIEILLHGTEALFFCGSNFSGSYVSNRFSWKSDFYLDLNIVFLESFCF